ncbi:hypothetical protein ONR75_11060 [Rhodopseudomonas sp. P2A-2r]|uniref:hypothetical protein n=1 Tax=Rhodopseudomonas sp. P2A-2r TaxID=2991972 RepID=UPI0022342CA7|nr:hypothetical protein [Rhodopseudomonas sp. P2A-2r]UZE51099.1 hypothetical protein ONR75_11060 [Rhodopseudomonas sp. P2A-2r]
MQDALRAAYVGPDTVEVIATRHLISPRTVNRFWESEKLAGRLSNRPRPHFAKHVTVPIALVVDPVDADFGDGDVQPTDSTAARAALVAAHGNDPLRGINDEMPAHTLEIERRDRDGHYTPSPSRLVDFQKGRDAYARSKMAEPPAPSNFIYARVGRAWWIMQGLAMLAGPFLAFPAAQEWTRKFGTYHKKAKP